MKRPWQDYAYVAFIVIMLTATLPKCVQADVLCKDWSSADTKREVAYQLVSGADWLQTRQIAMNPDKYEEMNPLIGKHPDVMMVDMYFGASAVGHGLISCILQNKHRTAFQVITTVLETAIVLHNKRIGIKIKF